MNDTEDELIKRQMILYRQYVSTFDLSWYRFTFPILTDFKAERNYLPRFAYPEIQKHCMERGLDFQVNYFNIKVSLTCLDVIRSIKAVYFESILMKKNTYN